VGEQTWRKLPCASDGSPDKRNRQSPKRRRDTPGRDGDMMRQIETHASMHIESQCQETITPTAALIPALQAGQHPVSVPLQGLAMVRKMKIAGNFVLPDSLLDFCLVTYMGDDPDFVLVGQKFHRIPAHLGFRTLDWIAGNGADKNLHGKP